MHHATGKEIKIILDPYRIVELFLPVWNDASYCCLRFVEPYVDTMFNRFQIPVFLAEWDRVEYKAHAAEEREMWEQVKALAVECSAWPNYQLWFIGD